MAKRPYYPQNINRKYRELPNDHPRRNTDSKQEAADALEQYWHEDQSFQAISERDDVDVGATTISRVWRDFFGPDDEDLTFYELGQKYQTENDDDESALNEYLRARKNGRLEDFKRARTSRQRQADDDDVPTPLNARELEIAREYFERGMQAAQDESDVVEPLE